MRSAKKKFLLAVLSLVGLVWFYGVYESLTLPPTLELRVKNPKTTSFIELYKDKHPDTKVQQIWVPYHKISPELKEAVVAHEDDEFFEHPGFNLGAIKKALIYDWKKKRFARGASTITQQLAKNLYLSPSKSIFRKLREILIAMKLERELSKQRILELYLNVVEWGPGIYGCEAAAKHYFGVPAAALTPSQAQSLVSILPNPRRLGRRGL